MRKISNTERLLDQLSWVQTIMVVSVVGIFAALQMLLLMVGEVEGDMSVA